MTRGGTGGEPDVNEGRQLLELARAVELDEPDARYGFGLLIRALEHEWLDAEDLTHLLEESRRDTWGGTRFEEFGIEPDWGDARYTHLRVSFLTERVKCPREPFLAALERLTRAWSAERS